ncbi:MAG: KH domain-containing protein [Patescibacteria group bacterium]
MPLSPRLTRRNSISGYQLVTINRNDVMAKEQDQEFVEYCVKGLVDRPEDVTTDRMVDEMGVLITLKVNPEDLGQVIGRQGQTAKALRTLLRVVGAKHHARVNLKIYEPEGHRKSKMMEEAPQETQPTAVDADMDDLKL